MLSTTATFLLFSLVVVTPEVRGAVTGGGSVGVKRLRHQSHIGKWVSAALKYLEPGKCVKAGIGSEEECQRLGNLRREQVSVYLGYNRFDGKNKNSSKVYAILPDSPNVKSSGAHDFILTLDPSPLASFGHLVALFYIDVVGTDSKACGHESHQTLTADGACISVAHRPRCPNQLSSTSVSHHSRRCHVDFLPTVYSAPRVNDLPSNYEDNLLECIHLPDSAPCPLLRSREETSKVLCDLGGQAGNSKRCDTSHSSTGGVGSNCRLFQTCDQAVLIGGGWNRAHSGEKSLRNIEAIDKSLKAQGFGGDNVKIFYGNGKKEKYFSSAMKTAMRGHVRSLCDSRHCADTFFIYLNNPTNSEGDMLLWDVDYNGIADELEIYSQKEFLSDISGCQAKRLFILADQENSEVLLNTLKANAADHPNVVLLTSINQGQRSTINGELSKEWINASNPLNCISHIQQAISAKLNDSVNLFDGSHGLISSRLSILGAPCDLSPPVNSRELSTLYQGCQNVPTSIWFSFDVENEEEMEALEFVPSPEKEEEQEEQLIVHAPRQRARRRFTSSS